MTGAAEMRNPSPIVEKYTWLKSTTEPEVTANLTPVRLTAFARAVLFSFIRTLPPQCKELVLNTIYLVFFYARNRGGTSLIFSILFCEKA